MPNFGATTLKVIKNKRILPETQSTVGMAEEGQTGDSWDVVVIGTGLIECIVASGLSIKGYSVLVLDRNATYGGLNNTLKLPTVHSWMSDSPEYSRSVFETSSFSDKTYDVQAYSSLTETESDALKKVHVDMMPKVLFSRSHLVEMILSCDISAYLEFQGVEDVYFVDLQGVPSGRLTRTPYSKKEVFSSLDLSLVEKRQVMRMYSGIRDMLEISRVEEKMDLDLVSDPFRTPALISNSQSGSGKSHLSAGPATDGAPRIQEISSFSDFQDFWKISDRVMDLVKYSIVFSSGSRQGDKFGWEESFTRYFNLLLASLNQHGCVGTPFLYPSYGTCDLSQSFSRLAAVKGSLQRLGTRISSILPRDEEDKFWRVCLSSGDTEETIRCRLILGSLDCLSGDLGRPVKNCVENRVLCSYMVLDQPLIAPERSPDRKRLCLASMRIGQDLPDANIAYVLQCDYSTGCCPRGYYIVYINKVLGRQEVASETRTQIQDSIASLLSAGTNAETRVLYRASYVYTQRVEAPQTLEEGFVLLPDPSVNSNSFFLLEEDVDRAMQALDESLRFLNPQEGGAAVTFQTFSSPDKSQSAKQEKTSQESSNQYIIKKLQDLLD